MTYEQIFWASIIFWLTGLMIGVILIILDDMLKGR